MDKHHLQQQPEWHTSILGKRVISAISEKLQIVLPPLFGFHLLQIGKPNVTEWLNHSTIKHKIVLSPTSQQPNNPQLDFVRCQYDGLPFGNDCLDVVLLPCTLEYIAEPKAMLAEIWRLLIPNGKLIIIGYNPFSWWGLTGLLRRKKDMYPWTGKFIALSKLKRWLHQTNFSMTHCEKFYFRPPFLTDKLHTKCSWWEKMGCKFLPWCGGMYLIVASKEVATMATIKPKWQPIVNEKPTLMSPTVSGMNQTHE